METKLCPSCDQTKPRAEFYKNRGHRDGLSGWCKPCTLADRHRAWREKHPEPPAYVMPTEKLCKGCGQTKPLDDFYRHKDPRDGRQSRCKLCSNASVAAARSADLPRHAAYNRKWARKNPDRIADIALKTRRGVPHGTYEQMLAAQNGKCAICETGTPGGNAKRRFHLDHNHTTGAVRGLLCGSCNLGIGRFHENPAALRAAASYLESYPK